MDDAVLVHFLFAYAEFAWIDDDADPAVVDVQPEIENRQAGLRGDRQARFVGELKALRAMHFLLREKDDDELLERGIKRRSAWDPILTWPHIELADHAHLQVLWGRDVAVPEVSASIGRQIVIGKAAADVNGD